ncbi:MAG: bifunctional aminoglycoside phosphotransferase/ATP-binding protein [Planctomycetota bacterium]|jgi:aminoglycoside phosphotransferase family enzyme
MNQDLYNYLRDPEHYSESPAEVTTLETHISWLFFAGDVVYKVKKPVKTSFLDFTSLAARKHACEEELRLNRRLTPWMYLGIREISRSRFGRINMAGDGEVIDYAVEMCRLPAERMLDALLKAGDVDNRMMRALAKKLARFHAQSASGEGVDEHGGLEAMRRNCRENFADLDPLSSAVRIDAECLSRNLISFAQAWTESFLDQHAELFERRVREGHIREGHGDLHAGNICILDKKAEQIAIYDCLEFSVPLRCVDVAADLAFLIKDLDLHGFRAFGAYLLHEYQRISGEELPGPLMNFYKVYRALIRAKVFAMRAAQVRDENRVQARQLAQRSVILALNYCLPPSLILTCGLPGSGKSWIAEQLGRTLEFAVFNSDRTRKRLAGMAAHADGSGDFGKGIYTAEQTAATYGELLSKAREILAEGRSVVIDAGMRSQEQRREFRELAAELGIPCVLMHADPGEEVIRARLQRRAEAGTSVSDADIQIYEQTLDGFEPPDEFGSKEKLRVYGDWGSEQLIQDLLEVLVAQQGVN